MSVVNSLMKIDLNDRLDVFLICSYDESKKHLRIILLDESECKAYSGIATDIDLRSQAAVINMIFTDFISLTLKALTKNKSDCDKFLYCIEKNCESFVFKWKSIDEEETIINIGSIKIYENDYKSTTKDAFLLLSEEMANLREKLAAMKEEFDELKKEMENSKKLFKDVNNVKESVENELFSKFTLILNEKKQKIRDLKRRMSGTSYSKVTKKQASAVTSRKAHEISDSSDEDVIDQDIMDVAGPSSSKRNTSLLFFDDEEPPLVISPSKKRNRNQHASNVRNPKPQVNKSPVPMESESEDELFKFL